MIRVYCHGNLVPVTVYLPDGWAICPCGQRIRVVW